jgi:large conductance mechanosensitive channel
MASRAKKTVSGFQKFLLRGNVVDLAVAIVIGAAFTNVIQALVKGIITPLIGVLGGVPDFSNYVVTVNNSRFAVGDFINAVISFVILAAIVYFIVVMPMQALMDRFKPEPEPSPTKACPECTTKIPEDARRCPQCTAQLMPPSPEVQEALRLAGAPSGAQIADEAAKVLSNRLQARASETSA